LKAGIVKRVMGRASHQDTHISSFFPRPHETVCQTLKESKARFIFKSQRDISASERL